MYVCVCACVCVSVRVLTLIDYTRQPIAEYSYENKNFCPKAGVCPRKHIWSNMRVEQHLRSRFSVELYSTF